MPTRCGKPTPVHHDPTQAEYQLQNAGICASSTKLQHTANKSANTCTLTPAPVLSDGSHLIQGPELCRWVHLGCSENSSTIVSRTAHYQHPDRLHGNATRCSLKPTLVHLEHPHRPSRTMPETVRQPITTCTLLPNKRQGPRPIISACRSGHPRP